MPRKYVAARATATLVVAALAACESPDRLVAVDPTAPAFAKGPSPWAPTSQLALPKTADTLHVGDSVQYVPTGTLVTSGTQLRWTSSDARVATVGHSGWVAAVAAGTATIAVTTRQQTPTARIVVTVLPRRTTPVPPAQPPAADTALTPQPAPATPAPTPPAPTPPAPTAPAGVAVYPGQSIQAAVNANPAGTVFLIKAGTHTGQSVVPKSGDVFYGEPGAVLDGGNTTPYAFWTGASAPYPSNVRVHGLRVTRYAPPAQFGAVRAGGHSPAENSTGWTVDSCEVSYNATGGIRIGHRMRVIANSVHHNLQTGVMGIGDSVLVERNEIAYNNYLTTYSAGWEAGGTKFVMTRGLVLRNNFVHHNVGAGLWTDTDNIDVLIEGNRVEDNAGSGIFHEISYAAVIRRNIAQRNGFAQGGWVYGGGITVAASPNVEVYENTVANNYNGITAMQQNRGVGAYGALVVQNLWVHDNAVTMPSGMTGIGQDVGSTAVFTARNNRFDRNTYQFTGNARPFAWMDGARTDGEWRGFGHDASGQFTR